MRALFSICCVHQKFQGALFSCTERTLASAAGRFQHSTFASSPMADQESEVVSHKLGCAGVAVLNRPKALNALNTNMVLRLYDIYHQFINDASISCVILKGTGEKAFCSGGDVRTVAQQAVDRKLEDANKFFQYEYRTDYLISQLPKPHIALLDGITMGGGVGVSVHGTFRVATERTLFAMPECAIGLFPDVGGSWFLPRLTGRLGLYLALTGARLKGHEVKAAGVATHYVPSEKLPQLEDALSRLDSEGSSPAQVDQVIQQYEEQPSTSSSVLTNLSTINHLFRHDNLTHIYAALEQQGGDFAAATLKQMRRGSPLSQHVTLKQLQEGANMASLRDCLIMEGRLAYHMLVLPSDFAEGVRAVLVDKDNKPQWRHASIHEVSPEEVQAFFAPLPPHLELELPQEPHARL